MTPPAWIAYAAATLRREQERPAHEHQWWVSPRVAYPDGTIRTGVTLCNCGTFKDEGGHQ